MASSTPATELADIAIDRSRIDDGYFCERYRYWKYEHDGTGIEKAGEWLDPLIGTAVHQGVESLLTVYSRVITQGGHDSAVERAVAVAREVILAARRRGPILIYKPSNEPDSDITEGMWLAEALVRGWAAVRLPALALWEIITVEKEHDATFKVDGRTVRLMTRADIVHRRGDESTFIRNLKTTSRVDQRFRDKWRYDMQTLSEVLGVEQSTGLKVDGVIIEGLVKGSREDYERDLNEWTGPGKFHWQSPLIWAWKRDGEPPMVDDQWFARYAWRCTGPHTMDNGRKCPGNAGHKLTNVHKAPTWTFPGGVKGWIDMLAQHDRELLEEQFVELPAILRSPYDIERWKRQTLHREVEIRERRDILMTRVDEVSDGTQEALLDRWFPMHTQDGNCLFPSRCEMFDICHGNQGDDLEGNGWRARVPNHPQEVL